MDLTTTAIGFAMSATFIIFLCTRFACGRNRQEEPRPLQEVHPRIDLEQPEPLTTCPLETVPISSILTIKFKHDTYHSTDDAQCSICLGDYQEKEVLRTMPKCGHDFHRSCIDKWLRKHPTCPICRSPLQDVFEQKMARLASSRMSMAENVEPASNQSQ
ncbi:unnamed protein product [Rhodiola kirilowii]